MAARGGYPRHTHYTNCPEHGRIKVDGQPEASKGCPVCLQLAEAKALKAAAAGDPSPAASPPTEGPRPSPHPEDGDVVELDEHLRHSPHPRDEVDDELADLEDQRDDNQEAFDDLSELVGGLVEQLGKVAGQHGVPMPRSQSRLLLACYRFVRTCEGADDV